MKDKARQAVRRAIKSGVLSRPQFCQECGCQPKVGRDGRTTIHAHHHRGYDRALDVVWLCPICHFKHDKRVSRVSNGNASLTEEQIAEIRSMYLKGSSGRRVEPFSAKGLGRKYGVNGTTIRRIVRNELWIDAAIAEAQEGKG